VTVVVAVAPELANAGRENVAETRGAAYAPKLAVDDVLHIANVKTYVCAAVISTDLLTGSVSAMC
jgi:hypothetical protein